MILTFLVKCPIKYQFSVQMYWMFDGLRLRVMRLILNVIFGGVIPRRSVSLHGQY